MLRAADSHFALGEIDTIAPFGNVLCMSEHGPFLVTPRVGPMGEQASERGVQRAFRSRPATLDAIGRVLH